jgi:hypothetical protein
MTNTAFTMKQEIRSVSVHRALILTKYMINLSLLIISIYLFYKAYALIPMYIFIIYNIMPIFISNVVKDYIKKHPESQLSIHIDKKDFQLNQIVRKYKYTPLRSFSNTISFFICILFLILWQYSYYMSPQENGILSRSPVIILACAFVLRFLFQVFYQIKIPYDLMHNKI